MSFAASISVQNYRLALDLGSTSLGWAILRLNQAGEVCAIIRAGVRIFDDGRNPKDGSSLAVTRRAARAMRRRRDRLLQRKNRLHTQLITLGFFPPDAQQRKELEKLNPYLLRAQGLERELSAAEFARALFHLNQRRGFLSNRKTDSKDNDSSTMKQAIKDTRAALAAGGCATLGAWLYQRQQNGDSIRARLHGTKASDKRYDFYADRALLHDEFSKLWDKQAELNPSLYNAAARKQLEHTIFYQRPLKPVQPGRCTLLQDEPRAPLALPSTQRFRILQELNNLRLQEADLSVRELTPTQRNILAQLLEKSSHLTFSQMRKALNLPSTLQFNLEDAKRDRLRGNSTSFNLSKLFGEAWHGFSLSKQDEIVCKLLNEENEQSLLNWLQAETGVDALQAEKIAACGLAEGYGNLSRAALQMVLPHLENAVISYAEAVKLAGMHHSLLSHAGQSGEIMPDLPYYGSVLRRHVGFAKENPRNEEERHGKIANPTVHIGLNQVRKVVNELLKQYGHPREITIEVARELKLSRKKQEEIKKEQEQNQKRNEPWLADACKVLGLTPELLHKGKKRAITQKMQLWHELNPADPLARFCPYSGKRIGIQELFSPEVEEEHILPYSQTLDDSLNNRTVAYRQANRDKGNRSPYEAFGQQQMPGYDYAAILQRSSTMPAAKRKRFAADAMNAWRHENDFLKRALTDTAYLSRIALEYLSCICPRGALAIPGRMTALLRAKLGLNEMLSANAEKNREDHRHHALDAIVIGLTDRSLLQRFATASARAKDNGLQKLVDDFDAPWPSFHDHVRRALDAIKVSHKPDHGYQGAMMEDTAWGFAAHGQARRRIQTDGGGKVWKYANRNLIPIRASQEQITRHGLDSDGQPRAYKGYIGGSNYCIEIWVNENGKWEGEVISTYDAYQIVRRLGEEQGWKRLRHPKLCQNGKPLLMRLMNKDYLRLELEGVIHTVVIAKIISSKQIFFYDHHEANVAARDADKENSFNYGSKYPGSLQKSKARRCTVSASGILRDPGFSDRSSEK